MIRTLKSFAAALVVTLGFAAPAPASTFGSADFTDLWWNPSENGWGVNVIQQGDTLFATLFVYGADNSARWYVGSALRSSGGSSFSGTLYQTTGPYFGTTFNPGAVGLTTVGSMTFSFSGDSAGTVSYSVNGVNVTKSIVRQSFASNNLSGRYLGGLIGTNCSSAPSGILIFDQLNISHSGSSLNMTVDFFTSGGASARCTFTGGYSPAGRIGSASGSYSCTTGNSGSWSMGNIDAGPNGFSATFSGQDQFCSYNGRFGGVRDVI